MISILVIEQDNQARQRLVSHLLPLGTEVFQAKNAEEGRRLYRLVRPDLVIATVAVSEANGVSHKKIVSAESSKLLEAIVSDSIKSKPILESVRSGTSLFLDKPITAKRVKEALSDLFLLVGRKNRQVFERGTVLDAELNFVLSSRRTAIAPTVNTILGILRVFVEPPQLLHLELALNEVIRNAFEHGNFAIGNVEKQRLCEIEQFEAELDQREAEAIASNKLLYIKVRCNSEEFCCIIEDEGNGFDWRNVPDPSSDSEVNTSLHGRGLMMIRNIFDTVAFNEKGNKVTLVKKFLS